MQQLDMFDNEYAAMKSLRPAKLQGGYGVPYMGCKSKLAYWLMNNMPDAEVFVDLFAGGCAVTHVAMLSGKYKRFICNDISDAPQLFIDAISGKYANEKRWIDRETFFKLKDTDPYIGLCWSFGNNRQNYLYSVEVEPYKKALHFAKVFNNFSLWNEFWGVNNVSSAYIRRNEPQIKEAYIKWYVQKYWNYEGELPQDYEKVLENQKLTTMLESLQRLQSLQSLQQSYDEVELPTPDKCVIYCDIPYKGTADYNCTFDHEKFYQWARNTAKMGYRTFISEYDMPSDFTLVANKRHLSILSSTSNNAVTEKLFTIKYKIKQL